MEAPLRTPNLRQASAAKPLYKINSFPSGFAEKVAKQIYAIKATSLFSDKEVDVSGSLWEQIFAFSINAKRDTPLANGIDDVQDRATSTAWSAKTVKWVRKGSIDEAIKNETAKVQLISGRNDPLYSYNVVVDPKNDDPAQVGSLILGIWNERVKSVRTKFINLRTVVMAKCELLDKVVVFEKETSLYDPCNFNWRWNEKNNLKGEYNGEDVFTWQPHGSQFTINNVYIPKSAIVISISSPDKMALSDILDNSGWSSEKYSYNSHK